MPTRKILFKFSNNKLKSLLFTYIASGNNVIILFNKFNFQNQFQIQYCYFLSSTRTRFIWRSYIIIFFQESLTCGAARGQTWIAWRTSWLPCLDVLIQKDELIEYRNVKSIIFIKNLESISYKKTISMKNYQIYNDLKVISVYG